MKWLFPLLFAAGCIVQPIPDDTVPDGKVTPIKQSLDLVVAKSLKTYAALAADVFDEAASEEFDSERAYHDHLDKELTEARGKAFKPINDAIAKALKEYEPEAAAELSTKLATAFKKAAK
jgi:hypothetical protein